MKTWRSWPWTIALAAVLLGFVLLGFFGLGRRTSPVEIIVSTVVTGGAVLGLVRVLVMGVRATPSGLIIRDLTRTTLVPWTWVRGVNCRRTDRRGVFAPVLRVTAQRAGGGSGRGGQPEDIEVTVLGSYREAVARRRADEIEAARTASLRRTR